MGRIIVVVFLLSSYIRAVPYPKGDFQYGAKVYISGGNESLKSILLSDLYYACQRIHRGLYAIENYYEKIHNYYKMGPNFKVLFLNYDFYYKRLTNRFNICLNGDIYLKLVGSGGYCNPETDAYVKTTFGFIHNTINICDLYFTGDDSRRVSVLTHEFGRLEGIGDSKDFDTDNIYVWDNILIRLDDDFEFLSDTLE